MGGVVPYPHSVLHLRPFSNSSLSRSKLGKPINFSLKEIAYRPSVASIRADASRRGGAPKNSSPGRAPRGEGAEDNLQSFESRSSASSKEEILALFKRIQSSISKGEATSSKNRSSKASEEKQSAESLLEVLRQSRTSGKGKVLRKKGDKLAAPQNDLVKKEESTEHASPVELKTTRPPSSFTKRSPITAPSSLRDTVQLKNEPAPVMEDNIEQQSKMFEDMKLTELKEVAKSRGMKGYSKLKKSELVELLSRS